MGPPLTFEFLEGSEHMDLTVGSLDDPSLLRLTSHSGSESWVPGWIHHDGLPTTRTDENPNTMQRWAKVQNQA